MNVGLLIIRIAVGVLLVGHGTQKLFGWFGGHGIAGTGQFFESLGYRPGPPMALLAGAGEAAGGLLALGLLTPLASAAVVGVLFNAIMAVHRGKGPWAMEGGWELPFTYAAVAAAIAFTGPGRFSLDAAIGWHIWGDAWGVGATVVGVAAGMITLALRTRQQHAVRLHEARAA
jgi:putative oxidoreductase